MLIIWEKGHPENGLILVEDIIKSVQWNTSRVMNKMDEWWHHVCLVISTSNRLLKLIPDIDSVLYNWKTLTGFAAVKPVRVKPICFGLDWLQAVYQLQIATDYNVKGQYWVTSVICKSIKIRCNIYVIKHLLTILLVSLMPNLLKWNEYFLSQWPVGAHSHCCLWADVDSQVSAVTMDSHQLLLFIQQFSRLGISLILSYCFLKINIHLYIHCSKVWNQP